MKNLGEMMRKAQEVQSRMAELQGSLDRMEMTGMSGGGMVEVTLTGKAQARRVRIDPSLFASRDVEVIEDLVVAAFNDAKAKVDAHVAEKMAELTGGLSLPPGFQLPF